MSSVLTESRECGVKDPRDPAGMGTFCDGALLYSTGQATNADQVIIPQFEPFRFIG